ncbi:MAG: hypothetical protein QOE82_2045 [Thermoanaerobaculia bacterium]|jgi:hypothetical protein|nr:hypothetical protein [Thermoanaerobaculia bacterium]
MPSRLQRASSVGTVEVRQLLAGVIEEDDDETDAPMPTPTDLPVPLDLVRRAVTEPIANAEAVYAPALTLQSFPAIDDDNSALPPDTNGAAGPAHLVTVLNTSLRIQDRNGGILQTVSIRSFFEPVRRNGRVVDPHVTFDARAGKWLICAITDLHTSTTAPRNGSALIVGISRTNNPLSGWDLYRYDSPQENVWLDFPMLGYDDESIVIAVNVYAVADDKFQRASVFVISRSDPGGAYTLLDHAANAGGSLSPTISMDAGGKKTYLVQMWNGNFQNIGFLRLYSVSTAGIVPIAFAQTTIPWDSISGSTDDFAPQAGRIEKIDTGDARVLTAVLRNGNIWAAHTAYMPSGSPTRSAVNWWRLGTNGSVVARGTIEDVTSKFDYAHPSIAVNRNNDALIGCSRFSATTLPSAAYSLVGAGVPVPVVFKDGEATYFKTGSGSRNRWGDYSAACVDPTNDLDFWTIQEYAATPGATSDRWGTWWARVGAPVIQSAPPRRRPVKH